MVGRSSRAVVACCHAVLSVVLWGCDELDSPISPDARVDGPLTVAELPLRAALEPATAAGTDGASCGEVTLDAPRVDKVREDACAEEYVVDLSIEVDAGSGPLLSFLRPYPIADWSVRTAGNRTQHDVRLRWFPYGVRGTESYGNEILPLIVHACPEGDGRLLLACSDVSCDTYSDQDQIPSLVLPSLGLVVRSPWGYSQPQELREGQTLQVPVTYEIARTSDPADPAMTVEMERPRPASSRQVEIRPRRHTVSLTRRTSGTVMFSITAVRDRFRQAPKAETFQLRLGGLGDSERRGCTVRPNPIQILISDGP